MTAKAYDAAKTEAKIDQLQSDLAAEKRAKEEAERERDSWKEQFHNAASAASEYSEFYERHHADFDAAGNYIPHSQIDGDLRAALKESQAPTK